MRSGGITSSLGRGTGGSGRTASCQRVMQDWVVCVPCEAPVESRRQPVSWGFGESRTKARTSRAGFMGSADAYTSEGGLAGSAGGTFGSIV